MNYVADFETYVPPFEILERLDRKKFKFDYLKKSDIKTYVWGYGIVEVGKTDDEDIYLGNNIDSFMTKAMSLKNPTIYFHNLKFDGHFILSWLVKNGYVYSDKKLEKTFNTIISKQNMFYAIEVIISKRKKGYKKITFYDSLKKLPFSVDKIGKDFGLDYNKIEVEEDFYKRFRSETHQLTEEEKIYIRHDLRVISQALQIQFSQGLKRMTNGSDALEEYKAVITTKQFDSWFPVIDLELNEAIRYAYRGGYTYASDKYKGQEVGYGLVYDVNSLYPSVMYDKKMPYGMPLFFEGEYEQDNLYDIYIQELNCEFKLKKNHIPTIQIKGQLGRYKPTEYLKESKGMTRLHLTNVDLKIFLEHYEVYNLEYTCGLKFRSHTDMFKKYIDKWSVIKMTNTGAIRELAKLMLNALYGKFATNPDVTGKYVDVDENGLIKLQLKEKELRDPIYTAVGVFTTAYGREITIRTAQENFERFAYCDTDSVHLIGNEEPKIDVHDTLMGKWKLEGKFSWAKFIGAKCYAEYYDKKDIENSKMFKSGNKDSYLQVTVAGMTEKQRKYVTKENFNEGLTLSGKLKPVIVDGGVVLVDVDYTLKVRSFMS